MSKNSTQAQADYAEVKKILGITDCQVAEMFGYSSVHSFRNAARKRQVMAGVVRLYRMATGTAQANDEEE